jgi:predicted aldo/keto reductase-like oxidoreductase
MKMTRINRRQFLKRSATATGALMWAGGAFTPARAAAKRTAADQVTLGGTGIKLSRLGMGTGSENGLVQTGLGREGFNSLVQYAYDHGITYFDCAQTYRTFNWLGAAIKGLPREKIFVQSKIDVQSADILATIDHHRKVLDTDFVDSMLVHCMVRAGWPEQWKKTMDAFDEAKSKGWIRTKGVSCHTLPALRDATASPWNEVHLVRVNPQGVHVDGPPAASWEAEGQPRDVAPVLTEIKAMRAKGRGIIGMKILGNGKFVDAADREKSIRFAMSMPELDAVVIGFKSRAEIDEAIQRINSALAES